MVLIGSGTLNWIMNSAWMILAAIGLYAALVEAAQ